MSESSESLLVEDKNRDDEVCDGVNKPKERVYEVPWSLSPSLPREGQNAEHDGAKRQ